MCESDNVKGLWALKMALLSLFI